MTHWLGRTYLRIFGWTVSGTAPTGPAVVIGAPHTSNWDFVLMLAIAWSLRLRPSWVGKDGLFRFPFGGIMRRLGGIPVKRDAAHNMVDQLVAAFDVDPELLLVLAPEGTRSRAPYWRSGFYHVAVGAGAPIATGFLDYTGKTVGFGPLVHPTGNVRVDMDQLRAIYEPVQGKQPENQGPIRLRDED